MQKLLNKIESLGTYQPSFFKITLNTNEDITDLNKVSIQTKATFFHEYIHFLQDMFTSYGLLNISYITNYVYNLSIESNKQKSICFPIKISDEETLKLIHENQTYFGTTNLNGNVDLITDVKIESDIYVNIDFFDFTNKCHDAFYLGSGAILESMAYIIERELFYDYNVPNFPYNIVEMLTRFLCPSLKFDSLLLVALCEISLNCIHPGKSLIEILQNLKKEKITLLDPQTFINYHEYNTVYTDGLNKFSIEVYNKKCRDEMFYNLNCYFSNQDIIKTSNWFNYLELKVEEYKSKNFRFFKLIKNPSLIENIFNDIGTPNIATVNKHYYFHPKIKKENCDIECWSVIVEIINILQGVNSGCSLKNYCKTAYKNNNYPNNYCDSAPWENSKNEDLCYFGALWKIWFAKN